MKLAVVGDIHGDWNDKDTGYFNRSDVEAVLFVGDLPPRMGHGRLLDVAASLSKLEKPAFLIPGNHDGVSFFHLLVELMGWRGLSSAFKKNQIERVAALRCALSPVVLTGYSHHSLGDNGSGIGLICGRPHAQGDGVSFAAYIEDQFGVGSMKESAEKLCALVDESPHRKLIFMGHNGPAGLGAARTGIWGRDFNRAGGDWGDDDLRVAIEHAKKTGRRVLAVVAGHMHHFTRTRSRARRTWRVKNEGVQYVNAARCPRIFAFDGQEIHHHIVLQIEGDDCAVEVSEAAL